MMDMPEHLVYGDVKMIREIILNNCYTGRYIDDDDPEASVTILDFISPKDPFELVVFH